MTKITIDRNVMEQALEAFRMCVPMDGKHAVVDDAFRNLRAALAEPEPPLGKASTDVGVPVYVVKKAEPPCNPSCAPGYCYCDGIKEGT